MPRTDHHTSTTTARAEGGDLLSSLLGTVATLAFQAPPDVATELADGDSARVADVDRGELARGEQVVERTTADGEEPGGVRQGDESEIVVKIGVVSSGGVHRVLLLIVRVHRDTEHGFAWAQHSFN
jgi:hypothetical protein